jgi:2-methylcitrate dehydratase PrpD
MTDLTTTPSSSSALAGFAARLTFGELSSELVEQAAEAISELLRGAAAGWNDESIEQLFEVVSDVNSAPEVTVVGRRVRIGAGYGACVNAAAAQVAHAGGARSVERQVSDVVAAAAIAVAEFSEADPVDLLVGVVSGLEVAARITIALGSSHAERGWRVAGSAGRIGAAVAAARTLRRSSEDHLAAIAFSATQAAGFAIGTGVSVPAMVAGRAANDGVESAVVAAAGLIGDPLPLEGRRGLLALVSDASDASLLASDLGAVFEAGRRAPNDGASRSDALFVAALRLSDGGDLATVLAEAELLADR